MVGVWIALWHLLEASGVGFGYDFQCRASVVLDPNEITGLRRVIRG